MRFTFVSKFVVSFLAVACLSLAADDPSLSPTGMVYSMTNAAAGNSVVAFFRSADGRLLPQRTFPTGGTGTGAGLGSQGSLALSQNLQWLFATNAGSSQISVFQVTDDGLVLSDIVSSGGTTPVSLTFNGRLLYVVNSGSDNIAGFRLVGNGKLMPISGSIQALSGTGTGPGEISFNSEGDTLVVTEKNTNLIDTFLIGIGGAAMPGVSQPSSGMEPFGFAFGERNQLFVTDAFGGSPNASGLTSYRLAADGTLHTVTPALTDNQTAACWAISDFDGRFVFVSNTGSNTVSSYSVAFGGAITLLQSQAAQTGTGPADPALSSDGRLLFILSGDGSIHGYRVMANGQLMSASVVSGLPAGAAGLAAF
jgi:6-phosphogluconolactonase